VEVGVVDVDPTPDDRNTHLELLCQHIALLLSTLYLTFVMLCLDIYLSKPSNESGKNKDNAETGHTSPSSPSHSSQPHPAPPLGVGFFASGHRWLPYRLRLLTEQL
jgi:hypothetical protein